MRQFFSLSLVAAMFFSTACSAAIAQETDDSGRRGVFIPVGERYSVVKVQCAYNKQLFNSTQTRNKLPVRLAIAHSSGMAERIGVVIAEALTVNGYKLVDQNEAILIAIDDNNAQELYNMNAQKTSNFFMNAYQLSVFWCDKTNIFEIRGGTPRKYEEYAEKDTEKLLSDVRRKIVQYFGN